MTKRFLRREVKEDGKGLFIYLDPDRYRPSKFQYGRRAIWKKGKEVSIYPVGLHPNSPMLVFSDPIFFEMWTRRQE